VGRGCRRPGAPKHCDDLLPVLICCFLLGLVYFDGLAMDAGCRMVSIYRAEVVWCGGIFFMHGLSLRRTSGIILDFFLFVAKFSIDHLVYHNKFLPKIVWRMRYGK
jgi:hypothetical protein